MKKFNYKRLSVWIYALALIALTALFFTNDFGLVDIRKSSIIVGVGIDVVEDEVKVTAQLAVPQPAENGENTQFTNISGQGVTIVDALKEINGKTGFYPKLLFCKLIILGESCKDSNIFDTLDYFYRNEYTGLMPTVAMCEGEAGKILEAKTPIGDSATTVIERILSDEAKKSANVSTVNLKEIGEDEYSAAGACYMPYIQNKSESQGGESGGEQGGGQSGGSGGGQSGGQSGGSGGQGGEQSGAEFVCNTTAIFSHGKYAGTLSEDDAFALNLLENEIRHAFISCEAEGKTYTIGLRNCSGGIGLNVQDGVPQLTVSFKATVQMQDMDVTISPEESAKGELLSDEVVNSCRSQLVSRFSSLIDSLKQADCDALGVKNKLYRYNYKYYDKYKDDVLEKMKIEYKLEIKGVK